MSPHKNLKKQFTYEINLILYANIIYNHSEQNRSEPMAWKKLGSGVYNDTYLSDDGTRVLKIQKKDNEITDSLERSVRIWNEINDNLEPKAAIIQTELGLGLPLYRYRRTPIYR